MSKIPKNLLKTFPNCKNFHIENSKMMKISHADLLPYQNLLEFTSINNDIEYLPGDLFNGFKNLELIYFEDKKFELIDPKIIDGLDGLRFASFIDQSCYHYKSVGIVINHQKVTKYLHDKFNEKFQVCSLLDSQKSEENVKKCLNLQILNLEKSLENQTRKLLEIRSQLNNEQNNFENLISSQNQQIKSLKSSEKSLNCQINQLKSVNGTLKKDNGQLRQSNNNSQCQIQKLKNNEENLKKSEKNLKIQIEKLTENQQNYKEKCEKFEIFNDENQQKLKNLQTANKNLKKENQNLKNFGHLSDLMMDILGLIKDESTKDFHIQINDHNFPVHKFLLTARCPTLSEILKNNPGIENLKLLDIPVDIFEVILKFLYTDELPGEDGMNYFHLFAAAGKLKIHKLIEYAATKIHNQINTDNALEVLRISSNYGLNDLKQKSFKIVQKKYENIELKDDLMDNPEKLIKIIVMFKQKEEAVKKFDDELKKLTTIE
ncbi:repetitive organellar protein-like isoform X2 [Chironomus tepperi]